MLFGAHVSTTGGIHTAVERGADLGCLSIQVFPQSPRVWKPTQHPEENLARFRERRAETGMVVVCHAPYLVNLASTDLEVVRKSVVVLEAAARTAADLGALAVIVHLGSHLGSGFEAGLARCGPALAAAVAALGPETWLLLENTAGAGGTMGRTLEELDRVMEVSGHERLGICLDSAHLYGSGIDIADPAAVDALMDEVERRFGLARLKALHVNDSQVPLASNRDRHANLGEGLIGDGLAAFLGHPRLQGLPALLETAGHSGDGPDAQCMAELRRLHAAGLALY